MIDDLSNLYSPGVALAIALLIGVERGWQGKNQDEGERVAGIRTYGLIGLPACRLPMRSSRSSTQQRGLWVKPICP